MASSFSGTAGRNAAVWQANTGWGPPDPAPADLRPWVRGHHRGHRAGYGKAGKTLDTGIKKETGTYKQYGARRVTSCGTGTGLAQGYLRQAIGTLNQRFGEASRSRPRGIRCLAAADRQEHGWVRCHERRPGRQRAQQGQERARQTFQAGPGYQWQVDQATDAAARSGNARGMGYSGNTTDAIARLGSNLANQEFQQWIENLQPYQTGAHAATAGQSGALRAASRTPTASGASASRASSRTQSNQAYQTGRTWRRATPTRATRLAARRAEYTRTRPALPVAQATATGASRRPGWVPRQEALSNFYNTYLGAGQAGLPGWRRSAKNTGRRHGGHRPRLQGHRRGLEHAHELGDKGGRPARPAPTSSRGSSPRDRGSSPNGDLLADFQAQLRGIIPTPQMQIGGAPADQSQLLFKGISGARAELRGCQRSGQAGGAVPHSSALQAERELAASEAYRRGMLGVQQGELAIKQRPRQHGPDLAKALQGLGGLYDGAAGPSRRPRALLRRPWAAVLRDEPAGRWRTSTPGRGSTTSSSSATSTPRSPPASSATWASRAGSARPRSTPTTRASPPSALSSIAATARRGCTATRPGPASTGATRMSRSTPSSRSCSAPRMMRIRRLWRLAPPPRRLRYWLRSTSGPPSRPCSQKPAGAHGGR